MAQILKDDVKERIVEAAKEEFLESGYEKASMRSIAGKSKITVGNLYHYFRSKEDLNSFIVGQALEKIQQLVLKITGNQVDILHMSDVHLTTGEMRNMLGMLGDGLVDIYMEHRIEVNILMMRSTVNRYLTDWFAEMLEKIIADHYSVSTETAEVKLMAQSYAESIFSGIKQLLRNCTLPAEKLKRLVEIYMESYVDMLDYNWVYKYRTGGAE